jgi:hypothetical protein
MGVTLELPQDLASALTEEATQRGLSLADYAIQLLSAGITPDPTIHTGADLMAYWQREGVVGTRTDIADSQVHARQLRGQAQRRG